MGLLRIARTAPRSRIRGKAGVATSLAAAAALAALPMAVNAASGGGLVYDQDQFRLPTAPDDPDGRTEHGVTCPTSHPQPTGGGVAIHGSNVDLEVGTTFPAKIEGTGGKLGWVGGANNDTGQPDHMTVKVICSNDDLSFKQNTKPNPEGGQVQGGANCPAGTKLVGGGVRADGDHKVEIASTAPEDGPDNDSKPDDRWVASVNNAPAKVTAICADKGKYKYVHTTRATVPDGQIQEDVAQCPNGTQVTGGGISITGITDRTEVGGSFPVGDGGWDGRGINDNTNRDQTMQVFAICKV